jgi:hypothetical protein
MSQFTFSTTGVKATAYKEMASQKMSYPSRQSHVTEMCGHAGSSGRKQRYRPMFYVNRVLGSLIFRPIYVL